MNERVRPAAPLTSTETADPFDLESLAPSQDFAETAGVTQNLEDGAGPAPEFAGLRACAPEPRIPAQPVMHRVQGRSRNIPRAPESRLGDGRRGRGEDNLHRDQPAEGR